MIKLKFLFILAIVSSSIFSLVGKAQIITSIAGGFNGDGYGATAIGNNTISQVTDAAGNIYIAVPDKHIVMKLSTNGIYSTVAGNGIYGFSGDGGLATAAQLKNPWNVAVDAAGNVFIADNYENRIRKVATNGIITTIAGTGKGGFSGDGGLATAAKLMGPVAVLTDAAGNIYIADNANRRVRKITTNGIINTIAGTGVAGTTGDGGQAILARLGFLSAIALNAAGELFIADNTYHIVRKVAVNGIISRVAGTGASGFSGDGGLATAAKFNAINGVTTDLSGNIYISDTYNNRVRKVASNGIITTIAGTGGGGFSGDGALAKLAQLYRPTNVAIDPAGNLLISSNFRIRKLTVSSNIINTIAGNGSGGYCGDGGSVSLAQFYHPVGLAVDQTGNIFFADRENNRVRKITSAGIITTIAGTGVIGFSGDGGPASAAQLNLPTSVAVDAAGNIFITDYGNFRIRKIASNGIITTIAGTGVKGFNGDGLAISATIWGPDGITLDALGNIYFADQFNNRIRKISPAGTIITIAGNGTNGFGGDGGVAILAALSWPNAVKVDRMGNVLIADRRNNRVRKVTTTGIISTVAGNGAQPYNGDGRTAITAGIDAGAITTDTAGNFYIADTYNERIRKVNTAGIISTVAGGGINYGDGGLASLAQVHTPMSLASDVTGNIFVAEYDNHRIRKISVQGAMKSSYTFTNPAISSPAKFTVFPNPVQSTLNIQTPGAGELVYVEILDISGKILLNQKVSSSQSVVSLQMHKLTPGIYFIRATDKNKGVIVKQVVKQ